MTSRRPAGAGRSGNTTRRWLRRLALFCALLFGGSPVLAQTAPATPQQPQARMDEAARGMGADPRMRDAPAQKRLETVEFVAGNMFFVLLHEMGHTHITEMGQPVLGRQEDAADAYATITMLKLGSDFSNRVLVEAAKGWFLSAERDQRMGNMLAFYDEHGLDKQRAYEIVCLMVGSDPDRFKELADWVRIPESRQETCAGDFSNASWSWEMALKPHRRAAGQPKTQIDAIYGEGKGKLDVYARSFRTIRLLETVADYAAEEYVWRRPFALAMQTCGGPNAQWDLSTQKLTLCYELAEEFVQLYGDSATERKSSVRMASNDLIIRNIRRLRVQHGMSTENLAAGAQLPQAWMSRMERGLENANVSQLEKLARALNVEPIELFTPPAKNEPPRSPPAARPRK
jgi:Putative metallopeptidase/Helix-turn-helix domain